MKLDFNFSGVGPNKTDDQIDALKTQIDQKLRLILDELQRARALTRKTESWYAQNTLRLAYEAVTDNGTLNQQNIASEIAITDDDIDPKDGQEFTDRVDESMKMRPTSMQTLKAWFLGAAKSNKQAFLNSLKDNGEQILEDAQNALSEAQSQQEQAQDESWQRLQQTQKYYTDLTSAIASGDPKTLVSILKSEAGKNVSANDKQALLMMPVGKHENALLAISQIPFKNPVQEAEVIATFLNHFGDDFVAFQVMQQTISEIADADTKQKYQNFSIAYTGLFLPAFSNEVVNVNTIADAGLYKDQDGKYSLPKYSLSIYSAAGETMASGFVDKATGRAFIAALAERPNFVQPFSNVAVNVNAIADAGLYKDQDGKYSLSIYSAAGEIMASDFVDKATGRAFIAALRKTGQNLALIQNNADQRDALMYGLQVARSWQSQSGASMGDDGASYLPLIIAAGVMLYANNSDAVLPVGHDFQSGGGGDFGGAGANGEWETLSNNFGDAALGSLDTSVIDSIQQGLDVMITGMDMGNAAVADMSTTSTFDTGISCGGSDMSCSP